MAETDELTGLAVLLCALTILGGLALRARHGLKRRSKSDQQLCAVRMLPEGPRFVAMPRLSITTAGTLCRLVLDVKFTGEYELRARWPFRRVVREIAPPFTLSIADRSGRVLHQQRDRLDRFFQEFWSSDREARFWLYEQSRWTHRSNITIFEFVPPEVGVYQVALEVDARAEVQTQWSSSWCEVLEAELKVVESGAPTR